LLIILLGSKICIFNPQDNISFKLEPTLISYKFNLLFSKLNDELNRLILNRTTLGFNLELIETSFSTPLLYDIYQYSDAKKKFLLEVHFPKCVNSSYILLASIIERKPLLKNFSFQLKNLNYSLRLQENCPSEVPPFANSAIPTLEGFQSSISSVLNFMIIFTDSLDMGLVASSDLLKNSKFLKIKFGEPLMILFEKDSRKG